MARAMRFTITPPSIYPFYLRMTDGRMTFGSSMNPTMYLNVSTLTIRNGFTEVGGGPEAVFTE
jgi:hypothetical protein